MHAPRLGWPRTGTASCPTPTSCSKSTPRVEALFNRGRARFELKRYRESQDDFRAALDLQPGNTVLAENLRQAERYAALPPVKAAKKR